MIKIGRRLARAKYVCRFLVNELERIIELFQRVRAIVIVIVVLPVLLLAILLVTVLVILVQLVVSVVGALENVVVAQKSVVVGPLLQIRDGAVASSHVVYDAVNVIADILVQYGGRLWLFVCLAVSEQLRDR